VAEIMEHSDANVTQRYAALFLEQAGEKVFG
jgi:hypothetical protein